MDRVEIVFALLLASGCIETGTEWGGAGIDGTLDSSSPDVGLIITKTQDAVRTPDGRETGNRRQVTRRCTGTLIPDPMTVGGRRQPGDTASVVLTGRHCIRQNTTGENIQFALSKQGKISLDGLSGADQTILGTGQPAVPTDASWVPQTQTFLTDFPLLEADLVAIRLATPVRLRELLGENKPGVGPPPVLLDQGGVTPEGYERPNWIGRQVRIVAFGQNVDDLRESGCADWTGDPTKNPCRGTFRTRREVTARITAFDRQWMELDVGGRPDDSGAPVFVEFGDGRRYLVALVAYTDGTRTVAMQIQPWLETINRALGAQPTRGNVVAGEDVEDVPADTDEDQGDYQDDGDYQDEGDFQNDVAPACYCDDLCWDRNDCCPDQECGW